MKNKNSAVDLTDLAIGIMILGITVSIGAVILLNVRDSQVSEIDTYAVTNESHTATTATNMTNTGVKSFTGVTNATDGTAIPVTNYTGTVSATPTSFGNVNVKAASEYSGKTIFVSYDAYNVTDPRYELADKAAIGLSEYGNWFDIIVIVGVAGLILALIFMAFGNRGQGQGAGGSY
jgi:hypothetical protein|tara:strand:- start:3255 stop:3785 length:531 start_codon:yes stop_codon:yes gene_type:complete